MLELTFLALAWLEKSQRGMFSNKTGAGLSKGSGRVTDVDVRWCCPRPGPEPRLLGPRRGQPICSLVLPVSAVRCSVLPRSERTTAASLVALILLPGGRGGKCGEGRMRLLCG